MTVNLDTDHLLVARDGEVFAISLGEFTAAFAKPLELHKLVDFIGPRGEQGQSIKGDKGDPGQSIKGDKGDPGKPGDKGDKGDPGESIKGDRGQAGLSIKGDKGDKGDMGPMPQLPSLDLLRGDRGPPGIPGKDFEFPDGSEGEVWTWASGKAVWKLPQLGGGSGLGQRQRLNRLERFNTLSVGLVVNNGATDIDAGSKGKLEIPCDLHIDAVTLLADASGSIVLDVKKSSYADYPTTTSIVSAAPPTIASAQKSRDTTLTGWTRDCSQGDILEFSVTSCTGIKNVTVSLRVSRK